MTWLPLESKMFTSVTYDPAEQILYLRFRKTSDVYRYFGFPVTEYQVFLDAESRGRFMTGALEAGNPSGTQCGDTAPAGIPTS
jgi:hypothetical protein